MLRGTINTSILRLNLRNAPFEAEHRMYTLSFWKSIKVDGNSYPNNHVCKEGDVISQENGSSMRGKLTWNAVPFRIGSSSPAGSPDERKSAPEDAIEV